MVLVKQTVAQQSCSHGSPHIHPAVQLLNLVSWLFIHLCSATLFDKAPLKWDLKIAKFAQQHADSITTTANCAAQFNEDNELYGENIFWAVYEHGSDPWTVPECFAEWVKQVRGGWGHHQQP